MAMEFINLSLRQNPGAGILVSSAGKVCSWPHAAEFLFGFSRNKARQMQAPDLNDLILKFNKLLRRIVVEDFEPLA